MPATPANLKHAERTRNVILFEIATGTFKLEKHFPKRAGVGRATGQVGEALSEYLRYKRTDCALSTIRDYKSAIEFHLRPKFGDMAFSDVNYSMVRAWLADLEISSKRKNNILIPLREIFQAAYRDGVIQSNPLDRIENFRHSPEEPNPFTPEEINQVLGACKDEQVKNLFQFAFYTGLRTSELIALRWEDVDLDRNEVFVTRAKVRKTFKATKTLAGQRHVSLQPIARDALVSQARFRSESHPEIFLNPKTGAPWIDDGQLRKRAWQPLFKSISVTPRNPYQTRHTFASIMLSAGEDPFWVSVQMGHKNLQMTLKRYARWLRLANKENGSKAAEYLAQFRHEKDINV